MGLNGPESYLHSPQCFLNGPECSLNGPKCSLNGPECSLVGRDAGRLRVVEQSQAGMHEAIKGTQERLGVIERYVLIRFANILLSCSSRTRWPRGTGFPRTLPSAVTSTVDHP